MMSTIVTFGLILTSTLLSLWMAWPEISFIRLAGAPLGVAILVPVLFNPNFHTLWAAVDLMLVPLEPGEALRDVGFTDDSLVESHPHGREPSRTSS